MDSFFTPEVEFTSSAVSPLTEHSERSSSRWLQTSIMAATVAVSGLLTFYSSPASFSKLNVDPAAVHQAAMNIPKHVSISDADRLAAARLRASFVEVPASVADREISPEYGL